VAVVSALNASLAGITLMFLLLKLSNYVLPEIGLLLAVVERYGGVSQDGGVPEGEGREGVVREVEGKVGGGRSRLAV